MYFDPFRNKWAALALAGLIVLAAVALVGSEGSGGVLDRIADRRQAWHPPGPVDAFEGPPMVHGPPIEPAYGPPVETGHFTSDAELLDEAAGFDTVPAIGYENRDDFPENEPMLEAEQEAPMLAGDVEGPGS